MTALSANTLTSNVVKPDAKDRDVIFELHELGRAFQNAVGAYMVDNPSKFPAGTLTKKINAQEDAVLKGLLNDRADVNHDTMSMQEMEDHGTYYGVHLHCLFMQIEERYLSELKVSFDEIADSIDLDVSDKAATDQKLVVCDRYGFEPIARLMKLKMAA